MTENYIFLNYKQNKLKIVYALILIKKMSIKINKSNKNNIIFKTFFNYYQIT